MRATLAVSAVDGTGILELLTAIDDLVTPPTVDLEVLIPYERGDVAASLHRVAEVLAEAGVRLGDTYPHPIVDHKSARQAARRPAASPSKQNTTSFTAR